MRAWICLALLLSVHGAAYAATSISKSVFGGGAAGSSGTSNAIQSTAGQPLSGTATGTSHEIASGFWPGDGGTATAITFEPGDSPPRFFTLHQNSPNPFTGRTTIAFDVAAAGGPVKLRVYDVIGRYVQTLVDGSPAPGRINVAWAGYGVDGAKLPSGIYFAVLDTPMGRFTKKMVLIR